MPNFDLNAAATVVMANIPGMCSVDEKELPSLKELYVGFSDMVRRTRERTELFVRPDGIKIN